MDSTCPHELFPGALAGGCSYCSGRETTRQAEKPVKFDLGKRSTRAKVDPQERLDRLVLAGVICGFCYSPRRPIGCKCHREQLHADHLDESVAFGQEVAELKVFGPKETPAMVLAAIRRSQRRAGITMADHDRATAEIGTVMRAFEVKPTWVAPRRTQADVLPI